MEILFIFTTLALIGLNGLTVWSYQKQINVLVDNAMSRSYPEFVQTKNLEHVNRFPQVSTQAAPEVYDDAVLAELNSIIS